MGNKIARRTLADVALTAIKRKNYLRNFYLKQKNKKGRGKASNNSGSKKDVRNNIERIKKRA
jgi:hypothetical protein